MKFFTLLSAFCVLIFLTAASTATAQCHINPDSCTLAVKIKSVKVEKANIVLETSEESQINYFALTDTEGSELMRISAKNTPSVYRFVVQKSGTYRIKVVNLDGTVEYTKYFTCALSKYPPLSIASVTQTENGAIVHLSNPQNWQLYNLLGTRINGGTGTEVRIPQSGIYILKSEYGTRKIAINF